MPRSLNHSPLLCWDIFMEGFHRRMHLAEDLKMLEKIRIKNEWHLPSISPDNALLWQDRVILITDNLFNIVYATRNIYEMNGYKSREVLGKSPRMFQGEATTAEERQIIRTAIDRRDSFDTVITNYKKDGSIYKCNIEGYPVFNKHGRLINFVAHEHAA